jgi:NAD(P)-dependent dehydrogenase (short-subunit alcohol dehydrogenase family)
VVESAAGHQEVGTDSGGEAALGSAGRRPGADSWHRFDDRTALVTGAASGIGFGIAEAIVERGGRVVLADIEAGRLGDAARDLRSRHRGAECDTVVVDVSDRESVAAAADRVMQRWGSVDVLVNNAGVAYNSTPTLDAPDEAIDWMFAVNVHGVLNCTRAFVPKMIEAGRGGRVLNTSSIGGFQVRPSGLMFQALYAATKYAIVAISEGLAIELEPHGIAVSVLAPAGTATAIGTSDRNRPDRFGGPTTGSQNAEIDRLLQQARPPILVGRLAARALLDGSPYVFAIGAPDVELVEARHRRIEASMRQWVALAEEVVDDPS